MSSAEPSYLRALLLLPLAAISLAVAGCQVRPLYGDAGGAAVVDQSTGAVTALSDISVKPVYDRPSQVVRNQLVFLLNRGTKPRSATRYSVALAVTTETSSAAFVQIANEDEPTAGTVTMRAAYEISDGETGEVIRRGSRQINAPFDVPRQQFAALRAERDAQDRAGRELAELLRLAIVQDLTRPAGARSAVSPRVAPVTPRPGDQTDRGGTSQATGTSLFEPN